MLNVTLALLLVLAQEQESGAVKGVVIVRGDVPPMKKVDVSISRKASALYPRGLLFKPIPIDGEGRLRQCLVFIRKGLEGKTYPVPAVPLMLKFDRFQLVPHITGVRVGQTVIVESFDDELHNAHSLPFNKGNKEFNSGLPSKGTRIDPKQFSVPEVAIKVKCDVHPWESAWIAAFSHPFFTVTDENGRFELQGLPPGKYTLEAWHENCLQALKEIEVKGSETSTIDFELDAGPRGVSTWELRSNPQLLKGFEGKSMGIYGEIQQLPGYEAPSPPFAKGTVVVSLRTPGMPWSGLCGLKKDAEKEVRAIPNGTTIRLSGIFKGMKEVDGNHFVMEECEREP